MTNVNGMTPWHMFLVRKGIMTYKHFVSIQSSQESEDVTEMARILVGNNDEGINLSNMHNMISLALDQVTIEVAIILQETSIELEFEKETVDETSALFPFMSMAASTRYMHREVYNIATRSVSCVKPL